MASRMRETLIPRAAESRAARKVPPLDAGRTAVAGQMGRPTDALLQAIPDLWGSSAESSPRATPRRHPSTPSYLESSIERSRPPTSSPSPSIHNGEGAHISGKVTFGGQKSSHHRLTRQLRKNKTEGLARRPRAPLDSRDPGRDPETDRSQQPADRPAAHPKREIPPSPWKTWSTCDEPGLVLELARRLPRLPQRSIHLGSAGWLGSVNYSVPALSNWNAMLGEAPQA